MGLCLKCVFLDVVWSRLVFVRTSCLQFVVISDSWAVLQSDCCNFYEVTVSDDSSTRSPSSGPSQNGRNLIPLEYMPFCLWPRCCCNRCTERWCTVQAIMPLLDTDKIKIFSLASLLHYCSNLVFICRCKQWVSNCSRPDLKSKTPEFLHKNYKLCSKHFETSMIRQQVSLQRLVSVVFLKV